MRCMKRTGNVIFWTMFVWRVAKAERLFVAGPYFRFVLAVDMRVVRLVVGGL